jgi:hypothetical protein
MTDTQLNQLKERYADYIVDGMDMDTLITFAIDSIFDNIKDWDEEYVKEEIVDLYGEETLEMLSENLN